METDRRVVVFVLVVFASVTAGVLDSALPRTALILESLLPQTKEDFNITTGGASPGTINGPERPE